MLDTTGGGFNYESSTGVYVWSNSSGTWTQERPADSLILRFPTAQEATGNNATFTLSEYKTESVSIGEITAEVPTQVNSSLKENGEEIFSSRLSVGFSSLVDIPESLESYIGAFSTSDEAVSNLTYSSTLSADFSDGITYEFRDGLENGSQKVVSTDATIALGDGPGSGGGENLFGSVDGETRVGQGLRVQYTADLSALVAALRDDSSDGVDAEGINNSVDVKVLGEDDNQVATLRYEGDKEQVVVEYPDGQTELLVDLLRDLDLR
ncbi:hypothetical protein [Salinibacter grassmerensis]|uniref:hypothetical protein n=1 Tax=Salinibacter grassmerensis TaxID=3040353 RepID=UPI0021E85E3B|nr:hypothetical protein [Salinibacter grassmerensis]